MKSFLFIVSVALALISSAQAFAQAAPTDLAKAKNCMACHSVQNKIVGPAFKDVAVKYKGQKDAAGKLAVKVIKGSSGVWGVISMPANTQVTEAEAHILVKWVLKQK